MNRTHDDVKGVEIGQKKDETKSSSFEKCHSVVVEQLTAESKSLVEQRVNKRGEAWKENKK